MNREACLKLIEQFIEPDPVRELAECGVVRPKKGISLSFSTHGMSAGLFEDNQLNIADPDYLIVLVGGDDYPTVHKMLWGSIFGVSIQLLGPSDKEAVSTALISRKM